MKKFIIFIMLFAITSVSMANTQPKDSVLTNTERLIDKYTDKAAAAVTALATQLKQPAEHVYKVLVKQQTLKAISWTAIIVVIMTLAVIFTIICIRDSDFREEMWGLPVVIWIIAILAMLVMSDTILSGFFNPEYGALKEIAGWFK